ncbi:MAG: hypothetical protein WCJ30_24675, partial [Deltaproteobacteria bacterium]
MGGRTEAVREIDGVVVFVAWIAGPTRWLGGSAGGAFGPRATVVGPSDSNSAAGSSVVTRSGDSSSCLEDSA